MRLRAVILDLDMTLIDSLRRFYRVFNKVLERACGRRVSWSEFVKRFREDTLDDLLPEHVNPAEFWREFRRGYSEEPPLPGERLIPGAKETLKWLKRRGYAVVVTTGREVSEDAIWSELRHFGVDAYVDRVYTMLVQDPSEEDVTFIKTGMLRRVLSDLGLSPREVVFVGDYWVDMESCRRLGIVAIGVLTGYERPERLVKWGAKYVIPSIRELPRVIEEL